MKLYLSKKNCVDCPFLFSKPIEPDRLFDCLPKSLRPTKGDHETDGGSHHPSKGLEAAVYRTPTLIPPRILPLMNDIAQQLVQAGNQQTCYKIYRQVLVFTIIVLHLF
jgi:exocyst complex component 7